MFNNAGYPYDTFMTLY